MQVLKKTSKQFPSNLKELDDVLSWFDQIEQPFIPKIVWLQCQLALAEAFTNVVRHAHKNCPPDVYVETEITLLPDSIEMRIWDFGEPFDLEERIKNVPEKIEPNKEGGRGLDILQKIADKLTYIRMEDNRNCLSIVKHYVPNNEVES